jgi:hypothetical protein
LILAIKARTVSKGKPSGWNHSCHTISRTSSIPQQCQADFTYSITPNTVQIQDTGKGEKSVVDDLEAVLHKIECWYQGSIAPYRISYVSTQGTEYLIEWERKTPRVSEQRSPE